MLSSLCFNFVINLHPQGPHWTKSALISVWGPWGPHFVCSALLSSIFFNFIFYYFIFGLCPVTCGILVPHPKIKPVHPSLEAWNLNHWTTRDVPSPLFNYSIQCPFQIFLLKPFPSPSPDLHFFFLSPASGSQAPSSPWGSSISGVR